VLINWCVKGIAEGTHFDDVMAERVLSETGLLSNWVVANGSNPLAITQGAAQNALSALALDDHVHDYGTVGPTTPYISLGAGCVEYQGPGMPPVTYPAVATATEFATTWGSTPGFIFSLWVITAPKPAADVPGLAEELRDLKRFPSFYEYHREGEIAAKLYVPRRQVEWVMKLDPLGNPIAASWSGGGSILENPDFVTPDAVSNVIGLL
jgi:hypothetical protein